MTSRTARQEWKAFYIAVDSMLPDDLLIWKRFSSLHCMQVSMQRWWKRFGDEKKFRCLWEETKVYIVRTK